MEELKRALTAELKHVKFIYFKKDDPTVWTIHFQGTREENEEGEIKNILDPEWEKVSRETFLKEPAKKA